jgi:hypothetical protein
MVHRSYSKHLTAIIMILILAAVGIFASIAAQPTTPSVENAVEDSNEIPYFEALLVDGAGTSGEEPYGILLQSPEEIPQTTVKLNEVNLTMASESFMIWRGDIVADVEQLERELAEGQTLDLVSRRRPDQWNLNVAQGVIKVRVSDPDIIAAVGNIPDLVVPAGMTLSFDRALIEQGINPFALVPTRAEDAINNFAAAGALLDSPPPPRPQL